METALGETEGFFARTLTALIQRLQWFLCGLAGHQLVQESEPHRLYLRCMLCAYETPGWQIGQRSVTEQASPRLQHSVAAPAKVA